MSVPLVVAAAFAAGCGLYYKYQNDKELEAKTRAPGDAYRLPRCCIDALRSDNGRLAAAIGAFVSTAAIVGTSQPEKPSLKSVEHTAKSGHDVAGVVLMNWNEEAALHADFMNGIIAIVNMTMFDVVHEHFLKHAQEDSQAKRFWAKLYERKKNRLPSSRRALENVYESIDK